jgi:hypothetical protein
MAGNFAASVVRLRDRQGFICGAGFLIDRCHVMSCAHVVNATLGLSADAAARPTEPVILDFPFQGATPVAARVVAWHPMVPFDAREDRAVSDVVVLRLDSEMPSTARLARMFRGVRGGGQQARCFGFPAHAGLAGTIAEVVTIAEDATGWLHIRQDSGPRIACGFSGTPIFERKSGAVLGMIAAFDGDAAYGETSTKLPLAWPLLARPYPGLAPFEADDAPFFFGREALVEELQQRVARENLVMIEGPTGAGKSSMVFGGLLPRLDQGQWLVASMRPGCDPLAALAGALVRVGTEDGSSPERAERLVRQFARDSGTLRAGSRLLARLAEIARCRGPQARLLLVVDAFEELFLPTTDPAGRVAFTALVTAIARQRGGLVRLLGTMRAGFGAELRRDPLLWPALEGRYFNLSFLTNAEMDRAIRLPAQNLGVSFEAGLDGELLAVAARNPAALPLLALVLEQLWTQQKNRVISRTAHERIGGLEGVLAGHVAEILAAMDEAGRQSARGLLTWLMQSASRAELGEELWDMARQLAGEGEGGGTPARLLVLSRDPQGAEWAELIHDSLFRAGLLATEVCVEGDINPSFEAIPRA